MTDAVELVLDLRETRTKHDSATGFAGLWEALEPALHGRDLRDRRVHSFDGPDGTIRLEIVRVPAAVLTIDRNTAFSVVAIRESPTLRYRCKHCAANSAARYAPFVCAACPAEGTDNRVCDQHVVILDGALTPSCQDHRPHCEQCSAPAVFRCAGTNCRHHRAWCANHRRQHPRDPDINYCPSCFEIAFPQCSSTGCTHIGTVRCEHFSAEYRQCDTRMCTRHALRWQVYGGERMGLAQCGPHSRINGLSGEEIVARIIVGTAARRNRERMPSLRGFGHTLRRYRPEFVSDFTRLHRVLCSQSDGLRGHKRFASALGRARADWDNQLGVITRGNEQGERLVGRLRELVVGQVPRGGAEIAAALTMADYNPPADHRGRSRRGILFIHLPEQYRGLFIGAQGRGIRFYSEQLGVDVRFEGDRRR
ncbi:hypothetical protein [Nocardia sp. NPDC057353]|uniref:hypothetical protein n=1 Tax=Nocardia sp. NPDC057353 TaxID=3346104 RepID=UPI00362BD844